MQSAAIRSHRCCATCFATFRSEVAHCPIDGAEIVAFDADPFVGTTVDHYIIDRCIGEGGMGRVYLAHHVHLAHRQFALKVLIGDLAASLATRLRFSHEAEAASQLHHENVVEVVDFGRTAGGLLYLAMEFVEGASLSRVIEEVGPLPSERVVALARGMCAGLAHAHARGFVHRDFKPDNVLLAQVGGREVPRIVDFGLAIELESASTRLTATGVALGTPIYAAPEQVRGQGVDQRADLFALGVTLYEMLAGRPPFDGDLMAVLIANATQAAPTIAERSPGVVVPPRLEALVRRLIARDPADRPASAEEVLAALDDAHAPLPVPVPRPRRRRWLAIAGVAIAGLVALGIFGRHTPTATAREVVPASSVASASEVVVVTALPDAAVVPVSPPSEPAVGMALPAAPARERRPAARREAVEVTIDHDDDVPAPPAPILATEPPLPPPAPPAPSPPPSAGTPVTAPPSAGPPKLVTTAHLDIRGISVQGPLAVSMIARALDRSRGALAACYGPAVRAAARSVATTVRVRLEIDESARARARSVTSAELPAIAPCISRTLERVRTDAAPDVGMATVTFTLAFRPESV